MRFYKSGIFTPTPKECDSASLRFSVSVDGFSMDMDNNGYYIVKFPWGTGWGENGNMRFVKNSSFNWSTRESCGFYDYVYKISDV